MGIDTVILKTMAGQRQSEALEHLHVEMHEERDEFGTDVAINDRASQENDAALWIFVQRTTHVDAKDVCIAEASGRPQAVHQPNGTLS